MSKSRPRYDETHKTHGFAPPQDPGILALADQAYAEIISDLERKLAAMVDERLASLERRVDLLYRYTVGDRAGRHMLVPNMNQRGEEFPE